MVVIRVAPSRNVSSSTRLPAAEYTSRVLQLARVTGRGCLLPRSWRQQCGGFSQMDRPLVIKINFHTLCPATNISGVIHNVTTLCYKKGHIDIPFSCVSKYHAVSIKELVQMVKQLNMPYRCNDNAVMQHCALAVSTRTSVLRAARHFVGLLNAASQRSAAALASW